MTSPGQWIDSTAFPHILDLIVEYADHDVRVVFRHVSSFCRHRVDAKLFRHIRLRPVEDSGYALTRAQPHPHPDVHDGARIRRPRQKSLVFLKRLNARDTEVSAPYHERRLLPPLPPANHPAWDVYAVSLQHVRCLDVHGPVAIGAIQRVLGCIPAQRRVTIRIMPNFSGDYVTSPPGADHLDLRFYSVPCDGGFKLITFIGTFPKCSLAIHDLSRGAVRDISRGVMPFHCRPDTLNILYTGCDFFEERDAEERDRILWEVRRATPTTRFIIIISYVGPHEVLDIQNLFARDLGLGSFNERITAGTLVVKSSLALRGDELTESIVHQGNDLTRRWGDRYGTLTADVDD